MKEKKKKRMNKIKRTCRDRLTEVICRWNDFRKKLVYECGKI
jgi:hypothetical protein